jgi:hypothetical protein
MNEFHIGLLAGLGAVLVVARSSSGALANSR